MVPSDVATMGIGQGIAVTPLQMIRAISAIANGGANWCGRISWPKSLTRTAMW